MKISTLSLSTLLGILGLIPLGMNPVQAQDCSVAPSRSVTCAQIYNATPDRVQLSGSVGEQTIDTLPQRGKAVGPFTISAPSVDANLYPNNILQTVTYAKANLQFNDGSLVWIKPDTRVTFTAGNNCQVNILNNESAFNSPRADLVQNTDQKLCLLSGSMLVINPNSSRVAQANLTVLTDEATIWKPASIYLITRNPKQNRTEVFVFSSDQNARITSTMDTNTICGISSNRSLNAPSQSTCGFRLRAGEYMTVTADNTSAPKPFDLPAWVATDPFFAPIRANTAINTLGNDSFAEATLAIQPQTAMKTIESIQPSLVNSVLSLQSEECPIDVIGFTPLGLAQLPAPQFNPVIPPPPPAPTPRPYIPPRPVRGMW